MLEQAHLSTAANSFITLHPHPHWFQESISSKQPFLIGWHCLPHNPWSLRQSGPNWGLCTCMSPGIYAQVRCSSFFMEMQAAWGLAHALWCKVESSAVHVPLFSTGSPLRSWPPVVAAFRGAMENQGGGGVTRGHRSLVGYVLWLLLTSGMISLHLVLWRYKDPQLWAGSLLLSCMWPHIRHQGTLSKIHFSSLSKWWEE